MHIPRLKFARRRAKRFCMTPCEITQHTDVRDDQGNPIGEAWVHKAFTTCNIDYPPFWNAIRLGTPGRITGPVQEVAGLILKLPLDDDDPSKIGTTDVGPIDLDVTDRIMALGQTYVILGFRGPTTMEVTREADVQLLGTVQANG